MKNIQTVQQAIDAITNGSHYEVCKLGGRVMELFRQDNFTTYDIVSVDEYGDTYKLATFDKFKPIEVRQDNDSVHVVFGDKEYTLKRIYDGYDFTVNMYDHENKKVVTLARYNEEA